MPSLRYYVQHSNSLPARVARWGYRGIRNFSAPVPRFIAKPALRIVILARLTVHTLQRVFWAEPLFKAYLRTCGENFHTGVFLHWVMGSGVIDVGDNVTIDGKCSFVFTSAYRPDPTLRIGSNVVIGHNTGFTIGKEITIGDDVMIAGNCGFLDTSGHSTDPVERLKKLPAPESKVRPIRVGPKAWIGQGSIILPGADIGEAAVIGANSVVRGRIPPFTIWAGNPATQVGVVKSEARSSSE